MLASRIRRTKKNCLLPSFLYIYIFTKSLSIDSASSSSSSSSSFLYVFAYNDGDFANSMAQLSS
jgi:hypothetical protein